VGISAGRAALGPRACELWREDSTPSTARKIPRSLRSPGGRLPPVKTAATSPRVGTKAVLLLALASILFTPLAATAAGVREDRPNLVGGELLGRGFALTLNYERFLTNHVGLGGGVMAIGTSDGMVGIVPLYASFLTGNIHSLYLSAGGAFIGGGGSVHDYESTWVMQGSVGYHFQSPGGFFVRPLFTFNQATQGSGGGFLVWPGITLGGSF
jgi:hypothetical protein